MFKIVYNILCHVNKIIFGITKYNHSLVEFMRKLYTYEIIPLPTRIAILTAARGKEMVLVLIMCQATLYFILSMSSINQRNYFLLIFFALSFFITY